MKDWPARLAFYQFKVRLENFTKFKLAVTSECLALKSLINYCLYIV